MPFKPGDIVIRKWSKASTLRGKVFKVIGEVPRPNDYYRHLVKIRVASPTGSVKEIYETRLRTLDEELRVAEADLSTAEDVLIAKRSKYNQLVRDMNQAKTYFLQV